MAHFENTAGRTFHGARISISKVGVLAMNVMLWGAVIVAARLVFG